MATPRAPEIVTLSSPQLEELLAKLSRMLPAETYQLLEQLLRTLQWLMAAIQAKNTTIGRLSRLIFGAKTEKTRQLFPQPPPARDQHWRRAMWKQSPVQSPDRPPVRQFLDLR